jgi:stress-induced morphogen
MDPKEIEELIRARIPGALVRLTDLTGGGDHWSAVVIAAAFEGKTLVEQHQMVYGALRDAMIERIHALELKTYSPARARAAGLIEE